MRSKESRPAYPIHSLEKTILILDALRDAEEPLGVTELSNRLGMTVSAVHRHLDTLHWYRMVEQDPASLKYALGPRLIEYGTRVIAQLGYGAQTRRHLERLASEIGETVNLCLLRDREVLFIDKIESQEFLRLVTNVGTRVPMHCTGLGKAILAFLPENEQEEILGVGPLTRYTPTTITDVGLLRAQLREIQNQGFAVDAEEYLPGVVCIAAPIQRQNRRVNSAVSVSGPISRLSARRVPEIGSRVKTTAKEISLEIARGLLA